MGYYGRRRFTYNRWYSSYRNPSQLDRLSSMFGDAVGQIKNAFLALEPATLNELLEDYGALYGAAAESYARKAFPDWKSGSTNLSGQTMQRLIALVPPYLSAATRFGLLQEVVKKQASSSYGKAYKVIRISSEEPNAGFAELDAALHSMRHEDALAHIPEGVMNAAKWLYDDDITAARAMLAQAEARKNEIIKASADREIELLRRTVQNRQVKTARYNVQMPAGRLSVEVFTPSKTLWQTLFG